MNNLRTPPLSSCKNLPPYFFMVHLLHRLYGVDAPGHALASRHTDVIPALNKNMRKTDYIVIGWLGRRVVSVLDLCAVT